MDSSASHLLEIVALGSCFVQCCMLLFLTSDENFHLSAMVHLFSLASLLMNNHFRGTRIHLYPLIMGFALYSLAFFFGIFEEVAFYYYYLTVLFSMLISFFFATDYYASYELSGARVNNVGCLMT